MHIVIMCSVINVLLCHTLRNNTKVLFLRCNYCMEIYSTPEERERHENLHDKSNYKHQCKYCNKWKKWKSELNQHLNSLCLKNPDCVIECVYCNHSIMGILQFINHLNEDHKKKGEQLCLRCQTMFKIEDNLPTHMSHNKCKKM